MTILIFVHLEVSDLLVCRCDDDASCQMDKLSAFSSSVLILPLGAMLLLLRFSTGENWNGFMRSIISSKSDCELNPTFNETSPWCLTRDNNPNCTPINGCGAGFSAFVYFYSFTLLISFVILNLFVCIVLDAFENCTEGDILSSADLEEFTKVWAQFDP